jgi:lambda family phage tail tape measure protein
MNNLNHDEKIVVAIEADASGFLETMKEINAVSDAFGKAFADTLSEAIIQGRSFESTLRAIGLSLSKIALNAALKPLQQTVSNLFASILSGTPIATGQPIQLPSVLAKGGAFGATGPVPFAKGGVVAAPSYFNFKGGTGVMGEAGAEAILPLSRGPDGKLGVAAGKSNNPPINIVFNVNATDAGSFQRSESQISAMLARAVSRGGRNM